VTLHSQTLSPDFKIPLIVPRGVAWDLGLRLRESGSEVTPDSASVSIYRDTGALDLYVASGALTPGTTTLYAMSAIPSTESLSLDWIAVWTVVHGGNTYPIRQRFCLVGTPLMPRVDQEDLYDDEPDLRQPARMPEGQTTWSQQVGAAWNDIVNTLTRRGKKPWLIVDDSDLYHWHYYAALSKVCAAIPGEAGSHYKEAAIRYRAEAARRELALSVEYEDNPGSRAAIGPSVYPCAPRGRPVW